MGTASDVQPAVEIERAILRDLAFALPVSEVLERICTLVEETIPQSICSVMLVDGDGALRLSVAPSLSRDLWPRLDGLVPGPSRGSCGRAAFTGEPVFVEDTRVDPVWADLRPLAEELGIRACWSQPIRADGEILGTFAISHPAPRVPSPAEEALLQTATNLAVVAIESDRARRSHRALERRLDLSQKLETIGQRAGELAHDLGNLITVILGGTDALRSAEKCPDPAAVRELAIGQIRDAGRRAAELVRELLRFGRAGPRHRGWIDPNAALAEIDSALRRLVHERIRFRVVPLETALEVAADAAQFQRLVTNLVLNAAEAMPDGGDLTLTLSAAGGNEVPRIVLEVRDTGCGIAPEVRPRIFEPFFTTKATEKGIGLGLSSVRSTVEGLGGEIGFESEVALGTVFRVTLPARTAASACAAAPAAEVRPAGTLRGRVLLCEDDALVRLLLAEALRSAGFEVVEAAHGAEAIQRAAHGKADLLVCDVVMPGIDGPTLLGRLRAEWPELPCIFISGYPRDAIERNFSRRSGGAAVDGRAEFLEKPFSPSELIAKIESAFGHLLPASPVAPPPQGPGAGAGARSS